MLLRKLVAALGPRLLCIVACAAFRWLDGVLGAGSFFAFLLKGVLLGAALALFMPLAGLSVRTNGLVPWLWLGAGLLLLTLLYQYMETVGALHVPLLRAVLTINGQVVLIESAAMGYLAATSLLYKGR